MEQSGAFRKLLSGKPDSFAKPHSSACRQVFCRHESYTNFFCDSYA